MANIAQFYNVGIEISYLADTNPLLTQLETFIIRTYRLYIPFDNSVDPYPPSLLTIDIGQSKLPPL